MGVEQANQFFNARNGQSGVRQSTLMGDPGHRGRQQARTLAEKRAQMAMFPACPLFVGGSGFCRQRTVNLRTIEVARAETGEGVVDSELHIFDDVTGGPGNGFY